MSLTVTRIVEERIREWEHQGKLHRSADPGEKPSPVMTISREFGGRGAALAALICKNYGLKLWDRELLQAIADDLGSDHRFLKTVDENRREMIEDAVLGYLQNLNTNSSYLRSLLRIVKTVEEHGNAIVVGRGATYICKNSLSFHVRVVAPMETRVAEYAERENLTRSEALAVIRKKDEERAGFVRHYFNRDVSDASDFDIVINSGTFDLNEMMAIVLKAYKQKTGVELSRAVE